MNSGISSALRTGGILAKFALRRKAGPCDAQSGCFTAAQKLAWRATADYPDRGSLLGQLKAK